MRSGRGARSRALYGGSGDKPRRSLCRRRFLLTIRFSGRNQQSIDGPKTTTGQSLKEAIQSTCKPVSFPSKGIVFESLQIERAAFGCRTAADSREPGRYFLSDLADFPLINRSSDDVSMSAGLSARGTKEAAAFPLASYRRAFARALPSFRSRRLSMQSSLNQICGFLESVRPSTPILPRAVSFPSNRNQSTSARSEDSRGRRRSATFPG